jgi:hypothetical protein
MNYYTHDTHKDDDIQEDLIAFEIEILTKLAKISKEYINLKENINVPKKFDYLVYETFMQYVIDVDGKIIDPKIIKSMNAKLDEKAIKVLLGYGDWIPAEQRGQKIKSKSSLPYSYFILDSK